MPDPVTIQTALKKDTCCIAFPGGYRGYGRRIVSQCMNQKERAIRHKIRKLENVKQPLSKNRAKKILRLNLLLETCTDPFWWYMNLLPQRQG